MRSSTIIAPLLGAAAVSAATAGLTPRAMSLFPRQITSDSIPSACQDTCASTIAIYQACTSNDADGCLKVCSQDTFNELLACFTCVLDDADSVSSSEQYQLNSAIDQLKSACSQAGSSVTGGLENKVTSSTATASNSAVASFASDATSAISGFTSAASGTTIAAGGGAGNSGTAAASTPAAVTTPASGNSGAGSVAPSAASSAASGAAGAISAAGPVLSAGKFVGAGAALVAAALVL